MTGCSRGDNCRFSHATGKVSVKKGRSACEARETRCSSAAQTEISCSWAPGMWQLINVQDDAAVCCAHRESREGEGAKGVEAAVRCACLPPPACIQLPTHSNSFPAQDLFGWGSMLNWALTAFTVALVRQSSFCSGSCAVHCARKKHASIGPNECN